MEKITLIHTNDLHSHLENWPKIRRYIDQRQREIKEKGNSVITVDLGDFVDRWHPLTEATNGQANIRLMNQVHYDAATIGNNEGTGNSKRDLDHLYDTANFDVLLANLYDNKTLQLPQWCRPYKVITTGQGTKVGLIAMTAPFPLTYAPNGWDIRNPMEILPQLTARLKKEVDVLVLMSHLGVVDDVEIAQQLPAVDVILGSHTHHLFPEGKMENGIQLAAAGKFGQYIGEVRLYVDENHQLTATKARTIATADFTVFPEDEEEINGYLEEGHRLLRSQEVAVLSHPLTLGPEDEFPFIKTALEAVKVRGQTEVAVLNSGLFLNPLANGKVDQDMLHQALPHPMHLIRVTLKGSDVERMVLEMEKNRGFLRRFPILGMGFRGKFFGEIVYAGIEYDRVNHQVFWLGRPLDPLREYTFTTVDHFMFVPFFPTIEIMGRYEFLFPEFIRSVVASYLHSHYPLT